MGFGTNLLELIYKYPTATEKTPTVSELNSSATPEQVFSAAIATAFFQNSVVRVNDSANINKGGVSVTPLPK